MRYVVCNMQMWVGGSVAILSPHRWPTLDLHSVATSVANPICICTFVTLFVGGQPRSALSPHNGDAEDGDGGHAGNDTDNECDGYAMLFYAISRPCGERRRSYGTSSGSYVAENSYNS